MPHMQGAVDVGESVQVRSIDIEANLVLSTIY
jgi:hypothetical protein